MKTNDIALAILIAFVSFLAAYWIGGMIFGDPSDKYEKIVFASQISDTIVDPDPNVFNPYAKNPTVEVIYGTCPAGQEWSKDLFVCVDKKVEENAEEGQTQ